MPLGCIRVDADAFPLVPMPCLRCRTEVPMRFAGPCPKCAEELRANVCGEARVVDGGAYEPVMHVTPNAVALKE